MSKIFVGLLLVFLDINFTFNTTTIGLLPDFIGYFILIGGLAEMAAVNSHFGKARPFAIAMAIYTLILYILDLIGLSAALAMPQPSWASLHPHLPLYLLPYCAGRAGAGERAGPQPERHAFVYHMESDGRCRHIGISAALHPGAECDLHHRTLCFRRGLSGPSKPDKKSYECPSANF